MKTSPPLAGLALLFACSLAGLASAEPVLEPKKPEAIAVEALLQAESFDRVRSGAWGHASDPAIALRFVLARPRAEAEALLVSVLERGQPGGQIYALCGLYALDPELGRRHAERFADDRREIDYCSVGCNRNYRRVKDVVRSPSRWAVRLPADFQGADWIAWLDAQGWPEEAEIELDVVGGGLPVEICQGARFPREGEPEGTLAKWLPKLSAGHLEAAEAVAEFGRPGYEAARRLLSDRDPRARRGGLAVISALGSGRLGTESWRAASLVAPLLLDPDLAVATKACEAIYALGPWAQPAAPSLSRALERVRALPAGEEVESLVHYLVEVMARLLGARAIAPLNALLRSPREEYRCLAGCTLAELRPKAVGARGALLKALRGGLPCALDALAEIGVEDRAQAEEIASLLETRSDLDLSSGLEILSSQGRHAGTRIARALEQLAARPGLSERDRAATLLALRHTTGRRAGVAEAVVRAYGPSGAAEELEATGLLEDLAPLLGQAKLRLQALKVIKELGPKARSLEQALRDSLVDLEPDHPHALSAGRALRAVSGDASFLVRVAESAIAPKFTRGGFHLVRELGPDALPLLERVRALATRGELSLRRKAVSSLRELSRGTGEAKGVPCLEALCTDPDLDSIAVQVLGDLARDESVLARRALKRLLARLEEPGLLAAVRAHLDAVAAWDR